MDLVQRILNDLKSFGDWNVIYRFDESEEGLVDVVKKLLTSDYGFLDIVLTKRDVNAITLELSKIDPSLRMFEAQTLLFKTILQKVGINNDDDFIFDDEVIKALKSKVSESNKHGFRIHVVFDDIEDKSLQQAINNLICTRRFHVMAYQSIRKYSYVTSNGFVLQPTHDYSSYLSSKYSENNVRVWMNFHVKN